MQTIEKIGEEPTERDRKWVKEFDGMTGWKKEEETRVNNWDKGKGKDIKI